MSRRPTARFSSLVLAAWNVRQIVNEPRNTSISHSEMEVPVKRFFTVVLCSIGLISSVPAHAQTKSQSYLAGGIARAGDDDVARYLSGGVERVTLGGLLGGADIGALFGRTTARPGYPRGQSYRQYALSAILGAHVPPGVTGRPLDPFVAGGVSVLTDPDCCGPGFLWNLGGGTNYWTALTPACESTRRSISDLANTRLLKRTVERRDSVRSRKTHRER